MQVGQQWGEGTLMVPKVIIFYLTVWLKSSFAFSWRGGWWV